jgi:hypothetical protein
LTVKPELYAKRAAEPAGIVSNVYVHENRRDVKQIRAKALFIVN